MAPVGLELLAAYRSALSRDLGSEGLPEKQREAEGVRRQHLKRHASCFIHRGSNHRLPCRWRAGFSYSWGLSPEEIWRCCELEPEPLSAQI